MINRCFIEDCYRPIAWKLRGDYEGFDKYFCHYHAEIWIGFGNDPAKLLWIQKGDIAGTYEYYIKHKKNRLKRQLKSLKER